METNKRNTGSLVGGAMLILFGLLALASQFLDKFDFWAKAWPLVIIGVGLMLFAGMFMGGKSTAGLAIPGSIVTAVGLILFFQNLSGRWESWSFAWTIILMAVGFGFFIESQYSGDEDHRRSGLNILKIGAILFLVFGAFFGMLFNYFGWSRFAFPVALVLLGLYLVLTRSGIFPSKTTTEEKS